MTVKNKKRALKLKYSVYLFLLVSMFTAIQSCQSNSRSGRAKLIATAMSKKEANRNPSIPTPETINIEKEINIVEIDEVVTPNEKNKINKVLIKKNIPSAEGALIQVEGLVLKEVSELTINLNAPSKQVDQILILRNYVRKNWHYIFDPDSGHDTFRSAEATISLKHNGKYPGDCDDYAILMASFARQIGLKSRVVGAYKNNGNGHAFAEFLVSEINKSNPLLKGKDFRIDYDGKWISLDWFEGAEHRAYKNHVQIIAQ
jgi:hypothetical protein